MSGGFGFAGLALAVVSLTTNWTSGVVVSHGQYSEEMHAPSSGLTGQQELNLYANGWHTQGWWALVFAAAAVLFGAGALLLPRVLHRGGTPGWAKAAATSAIIVGLVGVLLAVLTITGVFGGHLTAPPARAEPGSLLTEHGLPSSSGGYLGTFALRGKKTRAGRAEVPRSAKFPAKAQAVSTSVTRSAPGSSYKFNPTGAGQR